MSTATPPGPDRQPPPDEPEVSEEPTITGLHEAVMREQLDPRDGLEPIPPWMALVFGAVLFWGGYYTSQYSGGFRAGDLDGSPPRPGAEGPEKELDPVTLGRKLYQGNCASCHQATGAGQGQSNGCPPLAGSEWVTAQEPGSTARLVRIVLNGLTGPVQVKGQSYGGGNMPAWKQLKDRDIAAILTYVRSDWGNKALPVDPAAVAAARKATAGKADQWTADPLKAVTVDDVPPSTAPGPGPAAPGPAQPAAPQPQPMPPAPMAPAKPPESEVEALAVLPTEVPNPTGEKPIPAKPGG
jgi:mono/diheme cytochrome c family protein